jgi:hypothetical protein
MNILTECNDVFSNIIDYLDINNIKLLRLVFKNDILLIELINKCEIKYTNIIKFDCDIFNYNIKLLPTLPIILEHFTINDKNML